MGRKRNVELPSVVADTIAVSDEADESQGTQLDQSDSDTFDDQDTADLDIDEPSLVSDGTEIIEVPLGRLFPGHLTRQCNIRKMTHLQKVNLRRITLGLAANKQTLANGKVVTTGADALKWMLEQVPAP